MTMKKGVLILIGCISLAMGAVGAVVPLLPAFPFLMLAAICFAKSSERLHRWFVGTKLYRENLESYVRGKGMTKKAKIRLMITISLTMALGFLMMKSVPIGRIILTIVWICHLIYFVFGIKTLDSYKDVEYKGTKNR